MYEISTDTLKADFMMVFRIGIVVRAAVEAEYWFGTFIRGKE